MSQKNQDIILQKLEKLSLLDDVVAKLDKLETTVGNLSSAVESLAGKVQANADNICSLRQEFEVFKKETGAELRSVKNTLNAREQQLRSTQVRVFNFPVAADDSTSLTARIYDRILKPLLAAAKAAGDLGSVPQVHNAVESCYRVFSQEEPAEGQPPLPVIIRFISKQLKIAVLKQRRRSMPTPSEGEQKKGIRRFVIVEDLTPPAHKLLKAMQADQRTNKVWSVNGQIHYSVPGKTGYKKVRSVFDHIDTILS